MMVGLGEGVSRWSAGARSGREVSGWVLIESDARTAVGWVMVLLAGGISQSTLAWSPQKLL
jgi:hypothetical protein